MPSAPSGFRPEIYAIDFGTSHSLLAAAGVDGAHPVVHPAVPLDPGAPDPTVLRTLLYFPNANVCHYGQAAIDQFVENEMHGRLLRSIKRFLPLRTFVGTYVDNRPLNLENIIGLFLAEMRKRADAHFGAQVTRVVLGRPAKFAEDDGDDRYAEARLERAARLGGFTEVHFCPEPVAAARDFRNELTEPRTVLVGDFGGGTSDFTVIRLGPEALRPEDVLAVGGVPLAGDAFDGSLMRKRIAQHFGSDVTYKAELGSNVLTMPAHLMEKLCSPSEISILRHRDTVDFLKTVKAASLGADDQMKIDRLLLLLEDQLGFQVFESIEACKRALSESEEAEFRFDYPTLDLRDLIERRDFDSYSSSILEKITSSLDETLARAGLTPSEIDLVCCTGGTARIPALQNALESRFGAAKLRQFRAYHSVIGGLADQALALL